VGFELQLLFNDDIEQIVANQIVPPPTDSATFFFIKAAQNTSLESRRPQEWYDDNV
jgi:hypothetical protein